MSLRLLLVDDHRLFREGLRALLSYQPDFEVVAEAGDGESAIAEALRVRPDLILMDIGLPGAIDGVAAAAVVTSRLPEMIVIMLTVHDDTDRLVDAFKAGAQGYLVKSIRSEDLVRRLRGAAEGDAILPRSVAARILDEFRKPGRPASAPSLTGREIQVLELVSRRMSNKEIAAALIISEHTVKNHMKNILARLQVANRREAAAFGAAQGWFRPQ